MKAECIQCRTDVDTDECLLLREKQGRMLSLAFCSFVCLGKWVAARGDGA